LQINKAFNTTDAVKETIEEALQFTGVHHVRIIDRFRLLSENTSCCISKAFEEYLGIEGISHLRGKPYHLMTQEEIERYHRSIKNIIRLANYYFSSMTLQMFYLGNAFLHI
jgi:hypothetical protein